MATSRPRSRSRHTPKPATATKKVGVSHGVDSRRSPRKKTRKGGNRGRKTKCDGRTSLRSAAPRPPPDLTHERAAASRLPPPRRPTKHARNRFSSESRRLPRRHSAGATNPVAPVSRRSPEGRGRRIMNPGRAPRCVEAHGELELAGRRQRGSRSWRGEGGRRVRGCCSLPLGLLQ
jgi:hypothetical protein